MPLPSGDIKWPPTDPCVRTSLADWDAWYSSDPDRLADRYTNRGMRTLPDTPHTQFRAGVWGRLARWFWGETPPASEKTSRLHVPLAGDIARVSSELLFSEPPRLTASDTATQDALNKLMAGGLHPTLLEAGEFSAALGGAYLRLVWDEEISDRPWVDAVAADRAVPEFRYGRLRAVTFWSVLEHDGSEVVRHLERHERGAILHGLYVGSSGTLGRRVPLTEHPDTALIAAELDGDDFVLTGAPDHLTAAYIPNVRPARAWRNLPSGYSAWGQSDFHGIEGVMDALDEAYSSWMRDIINGKGRVIVPNSMLDSQGPGQGGSYNEERRIFTGLNMLQRPGDSNGLDVVQFAIRVEEHRDTCAELTRTAVRMAGYSASTFGEGDDGAAVTATEVRARQRRSMTTRSRKSLYAAPPLADITEAWLAVTAGDRFRISGLEVERPEVEFQDSISEAPKELAETASLLKQAEAASTELRVRLVNPGMDDARVAAEVQRIHEEQGLAVADPTLTGAEDFADV